jgi:hypothetical protein
VMRRLVVNTMGLADMTTLNNRCSALASWRQLLPHTRRPDYGLTACTELTQRFGLLSRPVGGTGMQTLLNAVVPVYPP